MQRRDSVRPRPSVRRWSSLAAPLLATAAGSVDALQIVDARDGVAVEAILSAKEPTRIRIEGAAIVEVFGNIQSSGCGSAASVSPVPAAVTGELVVECDRDKGEIYVRPTVGTGDASGKPVNLFVSSAHATYTLLLRRSDTPADTIVIRDRTALYATQEGGADVPAGPSPSHIRSMKAMLVAMASDRVPPDVRVDELHVPVRLWSEARFTLVRRYEWRGLVGERYLLQNVGPAAMVLAEPEFDRPDSPSGGQVLGVAIEHHNLRPGESTGVFVIRRGGQR